MKQHPDFRPFPFFSGCHSQTILAAAFSFQRDLPSRRRLVHLPDGDRLAIEVSTPKGWKEGDPTVAMVHGLCGSHRSSYMVRIAKKLYKQGVRAIRVNLRGCGSGKGFGRKIYHSESSEDIWEVVKEIKRDSPSSPLTVMGFSFGGNMILKMAGERGKEALGVVERVISVNPPVDIESTVQLLSRNTFYERLFMSNLRDEVAYLHQTFDHLPPIQIPPEMTLLDFNELYVAPQSGHETAHEYFYACSSGRVIDKIATPCHILFAKDDPIVDCTILGLEDVPKNIEILVTENGGHLGYLGIPGKQTGFHWMDSVLLQWTLSSRL